MEVGFRSKVTVCRDVFPVGSNIRLVIFRFCCISKKFNAVELYGLRELMVLRDLRRIDQYEAEWSRLHEGVT